MLRYWPLVLLFYAALLLLSGLLLLPLARALLGWLGHNLAAAEVAEGLPAWLVVEELMALVRDPVAAGPAGDWPFFLLLSLPAWPFFLALPSTILSAGAIAVYAGDTPRTDWRRLGRGIVRYAPLFILLLFMQVALYELALVLTVLLTVLVVVVSGSPWSILLVTPLLALFIVAIPWWFEYARVLAVVEDQRHAFRALGRAGAFLSRRLGPAAVLALYHLVLLLLPYLLSFLLTSLVPNRWWVLLIVVQQATVLLLLAARLARLAGQVALVQSCARSLPVSTAGPPRQMRLAGG